MQNVEIEYTKKSVQKILERISVFQKGKESGNYDAVVILVDILESVKKCNFTDQQKRVFKLRFLLEYTQQEVGQELGIGRDAVADHIEAIINKVTKQLTTGVTI